MQIAYSISQLHDKDRPVVPWSRAKTYELIKTGKLRPKYLGTKPMITHSNIEELIYSLPEEAE